MFTCMQGVSVIVNGWLQGPQEISEVMSAMQPRQNLLEKFNAHSKGKASSVEAKGKAEDATLAKEEAASDGGVVAEGAAITRATASTAVATSANRKTPVHTTNPNVMHHIPCPLVAHRFTEVPGQELFTGACLSSLLCAEYSSMCANVCFSAKGPQTAVANTSDIV